MPEEIEQNRDQVLLAERHQLVDLEHGERVLFDGVGARIEQMAERTLDGVGAKRRADVDVLDGGHKIGEAAAARLLAQEAHRAADFFFLARRGRGALLKLEAGCDPLFGEDRVRRRLKPRQRAEPRACRVAGEIVMRAAGGVRQREQRAALVEGCDARVPVAPELRRDQREKRRFAGAGRPEDERVADVGDVEIEPERGGAGRCAIEERRRIFRKERAWACGEPGPGRRGRHEVGEVQAVDQGTAHIGRRMPRQAAEPGLERVDGLDAAREAFAAQLLGDRARVFEELVALFAPQHENRGVIAERHQVGACVGHRFFGLGRHQRRVLVHGAAFGAEDLRKEPPRPLLPFAAVAAQQGHRTRSCRETESARRTETKSAGFRGPQGCSDRTPPESLRWRPRR